MNTSISRRSLAKPVLTGGFIYIAGLLSPLFGADIFKENNSDALDLASSWVGGVVPGAADVAVWDARVGAGNFGLFPASLSWGGVKVLNNADGHYIDSFGVSGPPVLTLGNGGFDLSAATSGTTFTVDTTTIAVPALSIQNWSVADGANLKLLGSVTRGAGSLIRYSKGATGTGSIQVTGLAASALAPFSTFGNSDFAYVDVDKFIQPASSVAGYYVPNPTGAAGALPNFTGNFTVMDFTVLNTNATSGMRVGGTNPTTNGTGFRFNTPHTIPWVVDTAGRNINMGGGSILVTPNVGTTTVRIDGSGNIRLGAGNDFTIHQNNTAADLIVNANISQSGTNPANAGSRLTKTGPGKVILASNGNNLWGVTSITEGTLQVGNGGVTGVIGAGNTAFTMTNVVNNGVLAYNRTDAYTVSNIISGAGQLTHMGTGVLTLAGANTYTGATNLNAGTVVFGASTNLGAGTAINFNGGGLRWGSANTDDISSRLVSVGASGATLDTNGNNVTLASSIGQGGAGSVIKAGAGALTLAGANTHTGGTTINAGKLVVANTTGSATGTGNVTVGGAGTLAGTGVVSGTVTTNIGSVIEPGNAGVGTLTLGGLTLAGSSVVDVEFASVSSYDKVVTTLNNGLTINGGGLHLYNAGGTSAWSTPGTYNLFQYAGSVQGTGASALSVLNPQAGYSYSFGSSGSFVTLQVELDAILSRWTPTGSGSWATGGNWSNGVPTTGYTAQFTTSLASPATLTLDGNRTVNGMVFDSAQGYTLAQGTSGSLTLDKGVKNVAVNVDLGAHIISAPVVLASTMAASVDSDASLTLSGVVSGAGGVVKTGGGLLDFTGHNTFTGSILVTGGSLGFAHADSLGSGALTLNGGTLRYDAGNTADISGRVITFGLDGAIIDTNGNDVIWLNPVGNGGDGALTKAGAGVLALDGANAYTKTTTVSGGTLLIANNNALGDPATGAGLILNGGTLATSATLALDNAGANSRPVTLGASGGSFNVADSTTLTVSGPLSGTGSLTKNGTGTLVLNATAASATGSVVVNEGTLSAPFVANLPTGGYVLNNQAALLFNSNTAQTVSNITVNGTNSITATVPNTASTIFGIGTLVGGSGTLTLSNRFVSDFTGAWTGFTGTIVLAEGTGASGSYRFNGGTGSATVAIDLGTRGLSVRSTAGTITLGSLSGSATSFLSGSGGGATQAVTYSIGGRNENSTFAGVLANGTGVTSLTKVGTGQLTLSGATTYTGLTTINGGTLRVDGSLAASTLTPTAPATPVMVNLDGVLAGTGTIASATTVAVGGALRPDASGASAGQLTFTNTLALAGTTQFDFGGTVFTGVKSTLSGGVTYGGALKINMPGTVYNGSYTLFALTGAPLGAFTGVTVSTANNANAVLGDSGGTWSGTDGVASFSFNSATGVLTVSGGATAVLPATPGGVAANAGNGQVSLTWNAAANASSYIVKRSTVSGSGYQTVQSDVATTSFTNTGLTNGTTYYYVIQAKNSAGLSNNSLEVSATPVAAPVYTALEQWRFDEFGVYADDGTVLAGNTEDFNGDGLVNILEYALGTDPTVANASPVVVGRTGNNLTLTYPRRAVADAALSYSVLGSSDLTTAFTAGAGATNTVGTTSTYTDTVDLSVAGTRRFLRLSVTYTAP